MGFELILSMSYKTFKISDGISLIQETHVANFMRCNIWHIEGQEVDLLITSESDLGVNVIINNTYSGMIFRNQIYKDIMMGDHIKGFIEQVRTDGKIDVKEVEASAIKRLRKEPDEIEQQEETEEETNDDFENLYKGQVSKSGVAILPSKRTRRIPEVKKPSLADEALSELKAEQPEIKEENLDKEEEPLELSEEATEEENKS